MKGKNWLLVTVAGGIGLGSLATAPVRSQVPLNRRCLAGAESCAYQDYPQYNQEVNYRTPPQIQQRRLNTIENQCSGSNSTSCDRVTPSADTSQETPLLQQLRGLQIESLQSP